MKIAINARDCVGAHRGGIGRYAVNLLETMSGKKYSNPVEHILYLSKADLERSKRSRALVQKEKFRVVQGAFDSWFSRMYFDHITLAELAWKHNFDIIHCLKFVLPLIKPLPEATKTLVTIHDLIYLEKPDLFPFATREYWKRAVKVSARHADLISVPSCYTRDQIIKWYGSEIGEKTRVIHHGVDPVFRPGPDPDKSEKYFLCVGTVEPRKNLANIVKAFEYFTVSDGNGNVKLVWAGKRGWENESIFDRIRKRGLEDRIKFTGHVDDERLSELYRNALALVFPSISEGFGLPVIEAMASGCPVIHSGMGALSEVAGNEQLKVDPHDPASISEAMKAVSDSGELRRNMIRDGIKRAKRYTWGESVKRLYEVYRELV
ncbi:MAG: glycosyltransferase family 1 protein [Candidatus Thermoplasmatota archaeon]|jgi:glycosyltransferase involved in cell wall biosynthesis|nr:glycosyltransferase family 1 protein [Candidatus Thermoplasmatota archaeon]MDP7264457.1 glycosyltransferase family 1 protein [Candidatus Thermoplasmatota archaeon]